LPDSIYYENDIFSDLNYADLYVFVDGVKTVNAKCIGRANFNVAGKAVTAKKNDEYMFQTQVETNPDSCCLVYYSDADCSVRQGEFEQRCNTVDGPLPIAVASWKVYNFTRAWTGGP
jgi:hypothetical protein